MILKTYSNNSKLTSCHLILQKENWLFSTQVSKTNDRSLKFKLDEKRLTQTDTVKYLGVPLDDHLLCSKQINHVANKLNHVIGFLSELRRGDFLTILKISRYSFCSHLLYGSHIWGQSNQLNITSHTKVQKLHLKQKFCLKNSKIL